MQHVLMRYIRTCFVLLHGAGGMDQLVLVQLCALHSALLYRVPRTMYQLPVPIRARV